MIEHKINCATNAAEVADEFAAMGCTCGADEQNKKDKSTLIRIEEKVNIQARDAVCFDNLSSEDIITNIKKGVSDILLGAVNGLNSCYRTKDGYIRWGLVEKDIHKLIDDKLRG